MKIEIINKRNYPVTEKLQEIIEKKLEKFNKYFDESIPVKVYLKSEGSKCKMELQLNFGKTFLTAESIADNMYDAVDKVLPKIEKQIVKHKGRLAEKVKINPVEHEERIYDDARVNNDETLVKVKEFTLPPMSIEDAMYEMDLSGHEFYVYLDKESNSIQVLYKRYDDNYGVIIPKI